MTLLRISMAAWGLLSLSLGLLAMLFPGPLGALGEGRTNTFLLGSWGWLTALLGLGVLLASRDPVRHILWLRLALLSFFVGGAYDLFHYLIGTVSLGVIAVDLAAYVVFGVLFLALFPRAPRMVPLNVRTPRGMLHTDADQGGLFLRQGDTYVTYLIPLGEATAPPDDSAEPAAPEDTELEETADAPDLLEAGLEMHSPDDEPLAGVGAPTAEEDEQRSGSQTEASDTADNEGRLP